MANWNGQARTNYVRFADLEGLEASIEDVDLTIEAHPNGTHHAIFCETDGGGWPSFIPNLDGEDEEEEKEFQFETHVAPFLAPGETLVIVECGAEKLRYLSGFTAAYHWDGQEVRKVSVSLGDIYAKAANEFGVPKDSIAEAIYDNVAEPKVPLVAAEGALKPQSSDATPPTWEAVCNAQGWNEESQVIHLEGFLRERGLMGDFARYAAKAADEENAAGDLCDPDLCDPPPSPSPGR